MRSAGGETAALFTSQCRHMRCQSWLCVWLWCDTLLSDSVHAPLVGRQHMPCLDVQMCAVQFICCRAWQAPPCSPGYKATGTTVVRLFFPFVGPMSHWMVSYHLTEGARVTPKLLCCDCSHTTSRSSATGAPVQPSEVLAYNTVAWWRGLQLRRECRQASVLHRCHNCVSLKSCLPYTYREMSSRTQ